MVKRQQFPAPAHRVAVKIKQGQMLTLPPLPNDATAVDALLICSQ